MTSFPQSERKTFRHALVVVLGCGFLVLTAVAEGSADNPGEDLVSILEGTKNSGDQMAAEAKTPLRKLIQNPTAEQNIFFGFIEKGDFERSLFQWHAAFANTEFSESVNGKGLYAYLLLKNHLNVTGLEELHKISDIGTLSDDLKQLWRLEAPESNPVWDVAMLDQWNEQWGALFGLATEVRVRGRQVFSQENVPLLKELLTKTKPGSKERAWIEWQLVVALALENPGPAAQALAHLMKLENNPVSVDLMNATAARLLYQNGYLDAAIKYYEKVPKSSDLWFEVQEEIGWAYIRKGEPQNSIAVTKTLTRPEFNAVVGPETHFLKSLSLLKVCDYPAVIGMLTDFQSVFKKRTVALQALKANPESSEPVKEYLARLEKGPVSIVTLGSLNGILPRHISRDHLVTQLFRLQKVLELESRDAGALYARSLSGGTAEVGFQKSLEELKLKTEMRVQAARSQVLHRIRTLAQNEIDEIAQLLKKMHIVEAEVLQQTSLAERVIQASNGKGIERAGSTGSKGRDLLVFPQEKEVWFDELANYRVDVKNGCQAVKR